jgi:hypothetical protein
MGLPPLMVKYMLFTMIIPSTHQMASSTASDGESLGGCGPCNTRQETNTYGIGNSLLLFPGIDDGAPMTRTNNNSPYCTAYDFFPF